MKTYSLTRFNGFPILFYVTSFHIEKALVLLKLLSVDDIYWLQVTTITVTVQFYAVN